MDEIEAVNDEARKRKQQINEYRQEREKMFENMSEDELVEYLVKMYDENEKSVKELNITTISEDDIK